MIAAAQPERPDALPSVRPTGVAWVHLARRSAVSQSLIYKEINRLHNNKGLTSRSLAALSRKALRAGRRRQLFSRPADELRVPDWLIAPSYTVVIRAPVEEVNSDGKANLDIPSTVKYGKELLNEQLIPQRYLQKHRWKTGKERRRRRSKISF